MQEALTLMEEREITDYDFNTKIEVFSIIGTIYARLMEKRGNKAEVQSICDALLQQPLDYHSRKQVNQFKARVSGVAKAAGKKPKQDKKKAKKGKDAQKKKADGEEEDGT